MYSSLRIFFMITTQTNVDKQIWNDKITYLPATTYFKIQIFQYRWIFRGIVQKHIFKLYIALSWPYFWRRSSWNKNENELLIYCIWPLYKCTIIHKRPMENVYSLEFITFCVVFDCSGGTFFTYFFKFCVLFGANVYMRLWISFIKWAFRQSTVINRWKRNKVTYNSNRMCIECRAKWDDKNLVYFI